MLDEWKAAILRHTPPTDELTAAGQYALAPAAGAAAVFFALDLICFGRKSSLIAAAWAMVIGCGVANYFRGALPWLPEPRPGLPLVGWHWIPLLFLLAQHDAMFGRATGPAAWGVRVRILLIAGAAAYLLVPAEMRAKWWPLAAFAAAIAIGWVGSDAVARQNPGGLVGLGLSLAMFGASFVMAHAHSARFADALSIPAAALFGISVVALFAKVDVGGAIPGIAVVLPAVLLVGYDQTFSEIPWYAFLLAALPPVTIGLLAVPPFSRLTGFKKWFVFAVLCLGPTIAAVTLAVQAETLLTEEW